MLQNVPPGYDCPTHFRKVSFNGKKFLIWTMSNGLIIYIYIHVYVYVYVHVYVTKLENVT